MKKLLLGFVLFTIAAPELALCGRGGDSFAGGLAGGMVGGLVSGAIAQGSSRQSRKDVEHEMQKEKVSQLQRDMDKKELEAKLEQQRIVEQQRLATQQQERDRSNTLMYLLFGVIFIMFLAIIGLGILLVNMRKKGE